MMAPITTVLLLSVAAVSFGAIRRVKRQPDELLDGQPDWCIAQVKEPCENEGICRSQTGGYSCECLEGHWGLHCEFDPDANPCVAKGNPCMNGGICIPDKDGERDEGNLVVQGPFRCACVKGFGGRICETNLLEAKCREDYCTNRGTIRTAPDGRCFCTCNEPDLYYGDYCEKEKPCATYPCLNGGTCTDTTLDNGTLSYSCACQLLYRGYDCEIVEEESECSYQNPCQNGATCIVRESEGDEFAGAQVVQCQCKPEYAGNTCEFDLNTYDPCADQSEEMQTCITNSACYEREFVQNHGVKFQRCFNGGVCAKHPKKLDEYFCQCPEQFTGGRCEIKNPCYDEYLIYQCNTDSVCVPIPNGESLQFGQYKPFACMCNPGQSGPHCTDPAKDKDCIPNPCKFDGQCLSCANYDVACRTAKDKGRGYVCVCPRGYTGPNCDDHVNVCGGHQCENRGECVAASKDPRGYRCMCPAGFSGDNCELIDNICLAIERCIYGDCKVTVEYPGYRCDCHEGYEGTDCSFDKNRRFIGELKFAPYMQVLFFSGLIGGILAVVIVLWAVFTCYKIRSDQKRYELLADEP